MITYSFYCLSMGLHPGVFIYADDWFVGFNGFPLIRFFACLNPH